MDRAVFVVNLLGALAAAMVNLGGAVRPGPFGVWRPLRAAVGVLALIYAAGYVVVLVGWVPILKWSAFYRGVSPVAWLVVWCGPALVSWRAWHYAKRDAAAYMRSRREAVVSGD